jgi:hypothetical protein
MGRDQHQHPERGRRRWRRKHTIVAVVLLVGGTLFGLQAWRHSKEHFAPHHRPPDTTEARYTPNPDYDPPDNPCAGEPVGGC